MKYVNATLSEYICIYDACLHISVVYIARDIEMKWEANQTEINDALRTIIS